MDHKLKIIRALLIGAAFLLLPPPAQAQADDSHDYTHSALAPGTFNLGITLTGFSMDWILYDNNDSEDSHASRLSLGLGGGILAAPYLMVGGEITYNSYSKLFFSDLGILDFDLGVSFLPPLGERWYLDFGGQAGLTHFLYNDCEDGDCSENRFKFGFHAGTGVFLSRGLSLNFQPYYERRSGDHLDEDSFGTKIKLLYFFPH